MNDEGEIAHSTHGTFLVHHPPLRLYSSLSLNHLIPFNPAPMNDGCETIHSTPLPGASPTTASVSIAGCVPQPQQLLAPQPPEE